METVLKGEGGGIAEIRERGVGDFIFGKLTVIFLIFQKFCAFKPPRSGPPEAARRLRRPPVGGPPQAKKKMITHSKTIGF